jgi:hypothetical protein
MDKNIGTALSYYCRAFLMWPFSLRPMIGVLKIARKVISSGLAA